MKHLQEAFFYARNPDHEEDIVAGLWINNDWLSFDKPAAEAMALDYVQTGLSNLRRWGAEIVHIREMGHVRAMAAWYVSLGESTEGVAEINFVASDSEHRLRGYGRAVMTATEERLRSKGFANAMLSSNPTARDFYLKVGYRISPEQKSSLIRMTKTL